MKINEIANWLESELHHCLKLQSWSILIQEPKIVIGAENVSIDPLQSLKHFTDTWQFWEDDDRTRWPLCFLILEVRSDIVKTCQITRFDWLILTFHCSSHAIKTYLFQAFSLATFCMVHGSIHRDSQNKDIYPWYATSNWILLEQHVNTINQNITCSHSPASILPSNLI